MGYGILHIFDAEPGKHHAPVGFCVGIIPIQNTLIGGYRLIKFALTAEVIGPVE